MLKEEILPLAIIVPERLFFSVLKYCPPQMHSVFYFSIDSVEEFFYLPYNKDFGPHSLYQMYKFHRLLERTLEEHSCPVTFYCSPNYQNITNSIFLLSSYRMIYLSLSPEDSLEPLLPYIQKSRPYRDASGQESCFDLQIIDCLKALYKAIDLNWYSPIDFDENEWRSLASLKSSWIIPKKILAFPSPVNKPNAELIQTFMDFHVNRVIRLCKLLYGSEPFASRFEMSVFNFEDGKNPPQNYIDEFLEVCNSDEVLAVHCEAGLGRTGTLIGCYLINRFQFSASEAIGWIRLCRPGSVFGTQQTFLSEYYQGLVRPREAPPPKVYWKKPLTEKPSPDPKQIKLSHETKPRKWDHIEGEDCQISEMTISLKRPHSQQN